MSVRTLAAESGLGQRVKAIRHYRRVMQQSFSIEDFWAYQYAYGHREILIEYAGAPRNAILKGDVQHGWSIGHHTRIQKTLDPWGREATAWLWEKEAEIAARRQGCKKKIAIGAPWLYLLRMSGLLTVWEESACRERATSILYCPTHHHPSINNFGMHIDGASRLASEFPGESVRILLSMSDFLQRSTRQVYEERGFQVVCAGFTGYPFRYPARPMQDFGDRVRFLFNIRDYLIDSRLMVTNGVGSHMFYAASLNLPVLVWPFGPEEEVRFALGDGSTSGRSEYDQILTYERQVLEIVHDGYANPNLLADQARLKLGFDSIVDRDELQNLLEWLVPVEEELLPSINQSWLSSSWCESNSEDRAGIQGHV